VSIFYVYYVLESRRNGCLLFYVFMYFVC